VSSFKPKSLYGTGIKINNLTEAHSHQKSFFNEQKGIFEYTQTLKQ
jgi:hypothetical protein